jgi:hypothetical protein
MNGPGEPTLHAGQGPGERGPALAMKVLVLHGWRSAPGGVRPTFPARHGHEVSNPKLPGEDFEEAVRIARAELDRHRPAVVVGPSRATSWPWLVSAIRMSGILPRSTSA